MKYIMCSRFFPKGHPRKGQPTYFIEQVLNSILPRPLTVGLKEFTAAAREFINDFMVIDGQLKKHHTIRPNNRFKPGETISLRVWSDKPYRSKQIEFAQVEVKRVWEIIIHKVDNEFVWQIKGSGSGLFNASSESLKIISCNDGLEVQDFIDWFAIHPKKMDEVFRGQIICWSPDINY